MTSPNDTKNKADHADPLSLGDAVKSLIDIQKAIPPNTHEARTGRAVLVVAMAVVVVAMAAIVLVASGLVHIALAQVVPGIVLIVALAFVIILFIDTPPIARKVLGIIAAGGALFYVGYILIRLLPSQFPTVPPNPVVSTQPAAPEVTPAQALPPDRKQVQPRENDQRVVSPNRPGSLVKHP